MRDKKIIFTQLKKLKNIIFEHLSENDYISVYENIETNSYR